MIREYAPEDKDAVLDVWYESAQVAYPFWEPQKFDFDSLFALEDRILAFHDHYQAKAKPFDWNFTRADLARLMNRLTVDRAA